MSRINKVEGVITNLQYPYKNLSDAQKRNPRTPAWAYVNYKYHDKIVTSKNTLSISGNLVNGDRITVWYNEKDYQKVFRTPLMAWLKSMF